MLNKQQQEDIQYVKDQVLAKFPLLGATMMSLPIIPDDRIGTAATDGKKVIYSPRYFETLSDEQKEFAFAHEIMHIAFNHILRSKGRDQRLWNIATDSVINQILKNENLPIIEGAVDIPEAVNHSAEEMYEKLLKKREEREQGQSGGQQGDESQSQQGQSGGQQGDESQSQQGQSDGQQGDESQSQQGQSGGQQGDESQSQQGQSGGQQGNESQSQQGQSGGQQGDESQPQQSQSGGQQGDESQSQQGQSGGQQGDESQSQQSQSGGQQGDESQSQQGGSSRGGQSGSSSGTGDTDWDDSNIDWDSLDEQVGHDTHDIWKEAVEEAEKQEKEKQKNAQKKKKILEERRKFRGEENDETSDAQAVSPADEDQSSKDEKEFSAINQAKRQEQAAEIRKELERIKAEMLQNRGHESFKNVGETKKPVADWKKLLKKSVEEENDRWSYRRSSAENDYMARVEELDDDCRSETEVMLDVSGSIDAELLREFLRQLKPLIKSSKLKVGCFDDCVYDFQEIKTNKDIDNFPLPLFGGGTNLDLPVRAFSKKKEVNKIIFTDGFAFPDEMPREDLKNKNVIWVVFANKDFAPCCGKVIFASEQEFGRRSSFYPFFRGGR